MSKVGTAGKEKSIWALNIWCVYWIGTKSFSAAAFSFSGCLIHCKTTFYRILVLLSQSRTFYSGYHRTRKCANAEESGTKTPSICKYLSGNKCVRLDLKFGLFRDSTLATIKLVRKLAFWEYQNQRKFIKTKNQSNWFFKYWFASIFYCFLSVGRINLWFYESLFGFSK